MPLDSPSWSRWFLPQLPWLPVPLRYLIPAALVLILMGIGLRTVRREASYDAIIYTRDSRSAGNYDIFVMREDGTEKRNETDFSSYDDYAVWSPDGAVFAFQSDRGGDTDIYIMASGIARRMTALAGDDVWPIWSPDGTRLAFTNRGEGTDQVFVVNADGTGLTNERARNDAATSWSVNDLILVKSDGQGVSEIVVVRPDGSGRRVLTSTG